MDYGRRYARASSQMVPRVSGHIACRAVLPVSDIPADIVTDLVQIWARNWSDQRITLLGDAAHPMLPYLAQGVCVAVEDSVCLENSLAEFSGDAVLAFRAYELARMPRTASVQLAGREMGEMNHLDGVARERRNAALAARDPRNHESNAWLFETEGPRDVKSGVGFFGPVR